MAHVSTLDNVKLHTRQFNTTNVIRFQGPTAYRCIASSGVH